VKPDWILYEVYTTHYSLNITALEENPTYPVKFMKKKNSRTTEFWKEHTRELSTYLQW